MKRLLLIPAIGFSATYFLKAQGANVLVYSPLSIVHTVLNDTLNFQEYAGTYLMKENPYLDEVTLNVKNGQLVSITPEGEEIILQPTNKDEFFIAPFNARVVFLRDKDIIKTVKVLVKGQEMLGEKK